MRSAAALILGLAVTAPVAADIAVEHAWVRAAPPGSRTLAAYLELVNTGPRTRRLVAARSTACDSVSLHRSAIVEGIARMAPVEAIPVEPGGRRRLEPGGYHLMLHGPRGLPSPGDTLALELEFADGTRVSVEAPVRRDATGSESAPHHGHP